MLSLFSFWVYFYSGGLYCPTPTPTPTSSEGNQSISYDFLGERYSQCSYLAKGGMGLISKAYDQNLGKWVAIKILPRANSNDSDLVRFQQEAKAASRLNHPNIVTILDFGVGSNDQQYLVMDYVEGESLASLLKRTGPLPAERALAILMQICDGLSHAHAKRIVHRDLKPSNVLITKEGTVKILDFGVAKVEGNAIDSLTKTGVVMGTPRYMSPEQIKGNAVSNQSDLYSIGCLIFKLLTGSVPFSGKSAMEIYRKHLNNEPPLLGELYDVEFSEELETIANRLLRKNPQERYDSMDDLRAALVRLIEQDEIKESPVEIEPELEEWALDTRTINGMTPKKSSSIFFWSSVVCVIFLSGFAVVFWVFSFTDSSSKDATVKKALLRKQMISNFGLSRIDDDSAYLKYVSSTRLSEITSQLNLKKIKSLRLKDSSLNNNLKAFVGAPLERLELTNCTLSDSEYSSVRHMKKIKYIRLSGGNTLTRKSLIYLTDLPNLVHLILDDSNYTNDDMIVVGNLKHLEFLSVSRTKNIDIDGILNLAPAKNLRRLRIGGLDYEKFPFAKLKILKNLKKLDIDDGGALNEARISEIEKIFPGVKVAIYESPLLKNYLKYNQAK